MKETNNYIIYGTNGELFLKLNESQINLLNLLTNDGIIDKSDILVLNEIEFKTI